MKIGTRLAAGFFVVLLAGSAAEDHTDAKTVGHRHSPVMLPPRIALRIPDGVPKGKR